MNTRAAVLVAFLATHLIVSLCSGAAIHLSKTVIPPSINSRITNGQNAVPGEHPYQVSIWWGFPPSIPPRHYCGGAIISNEWVITAGHCFTDAPNYGSLTVHAGTYTNAKDEPNRQSSAIKQYIIHPKYQGDAGPHDLALIRLTTPFKFTSTVAAIALPSQGTSPTGNAVLTGWGSISTNETIIRPKVLQKATVPIITNTECYNALVNFIGPSTIDTSNICTGPLDKSGIAFCSGDSGGPLAQRLNRVWQLVGIVSWGVFPCGYPGIPSIYVKVSSYTNWIVQQVAANSRSTIHYK